MFLLDLPQIFRADPYSYSNIRVNFLCKRPTTKKLSRCNSRYEYIRTPVWKVLYTLLKESYLATSGTDSSCQT